MKEKDYHLIDPTWCPGCGLYGIFAALKKAAAAVAIDPEQFVIVSGIGCHGRINNYFKANGFHGLHGRSLPVASGIKLTNPKLSVIAVSGDGDAYSIGLSHFIHSLRRNVNLTYIVVDNQVYALTQGQTSPTSQRGFVSSSTPYGSKEIPLRGGLLALASGGPFIARGFSGEPENLAALIEAGIRYKGFSLIDVLSPCVTHNKINTYQWFKNNIFRIEDEPDYDATDKRNAWEILVREDKIPVGLIYREERPLFEDLVLPDKEPIAFEDLSVALESLKKILETFE